MSFSALLDKTANLERPTTTKDPSGASTRSFGTALSGIACAVMPATSKIRQDYAMRQMVVDHVITTTTNLDTATNLLGGTVGGAKLGDRWLLGGEYYIVRGYERLGNTVFTAETLYQSICELIRV